METLSHDQGNVGVSKQFWQRVGDGGEKVGWREGDEWPLCTFGMIKKWSLNMTTTLTEHYRDDIIECYLFIGVTLVSEAPEARKKALDTHLLVCPASHAIME